MAIDYLTKVCALLAAANFKPSEVEQIFIRLSTIPLDRAMRQYEFAKELLGGNDVRPVRNIEITEPDGIAAKIEKLLIEEARLPKFMAASALAEKLRQLGMVGVPDFNSKSGFSEWLRHLEHLIPLSVLLSAATTIRNEYVHESADDWLGRQRR